MKLTFLLPFLLTVAAAHAATLHVTTTADTGAGSLRAQIAAAASGDTLDFINPATGAITTGTIVLTNTTTTGTLPITGKNLNIVGPGANSLTITTLPNATTGVSTRALSIVNAQCTISGITFNNCKGLPGDVDTGGAIAVDNFSAGGTTKITTISDCAFTNNQSGWGGAVDIFQGGLAMNRCTFSGNSCTGVAFGTNGGGGALSIGPTVASTITNCTFSANSQNGAATGQPGGGAIFNYGVGLANPPTLTVEHCTFVGNVDASGVAGAIRGNYTTSYHTAATLRNCLLVNNQAPAAALKNFAGNPTGSLTASYTSLGGNVTDEAATSALFMSPGTDKTNNAVIAPTVASTLALNGAAVGTHAITRGSPAQRSGLASTVTTDQRGAPRHANADAGAFELIEPEISVTVASVPVGENGALTFGPTPIGTPAVKTVTITNTQTSTFASGALSLGAVSSPAGFSVTGFPSAPLGNGESASFSVTLSAQNTGVTSAPLAFTGNDALNPSLALAIAGSPNQHVINLSGLVTDTADHWRTQNFSPAAIASGLAADLANPAGDGIANLIKYSLGLDPQIAYPPGTAISTALDADGHLSMTVLKNPLAADVNLAIEVTGDLGTPSAWNSDETIVDQNTSTVFQAHDNMPRAATHARFIRLKVTRP